MYRFASHRPRIGPLFALYAVLSALPVLALGLILAGSVRHEAQQRGLEQGRDEATLVARTAIGPQLDGRPLNRALSHHETLKLTRLMRWVVGPGVLQLRVRDLSGLVRFPAADAKLPPDPGAIAAAHGHVTAHLTRLDAMAANGRTHPGPRSVEVSMPLHDRAASGASQVSGVLQLYVPYAPIDAAIRRLLSTLYRDLAIGLGVLYLVLFAITASVCNRLRRAADRNGFLARHDALTGLLGRVAFVEAIAQAMARAQRSGRPIAIAVLDLDAFQAINDTLGTTNGDRVLCELGGRLATECPPNDVVARLGADQFGVLLIGRDDPDAELTRLRAALGRELAIAGLTLAVETSIGWTGFPGDGTRAEQLVQRADVAMYAAKTQHTGVTRYAPELERHDAAGLGLVTELRHAIDDNQLVLHYQPQVQLRTGRVVALEALVRWQHPVHGLLYPDRFLPLAEQTDVIERLTAWVLRRALRDVSAISPERGGPRVAVNVSARSLGRGALADEVLAALDELAAEPDRLLIEVTETAILADPTRAAAELARLTHAGVKISLDDFGRGQTSIAHLSAMPLHELKIDRGFVGDMDDDPVHAAIVRSLVELGRNLGLHVVAEGVETDAVRAQLRDCATDTIQGYLISRPLPLDEVVDWMLARGERGESAPSPRSGVTGPRLLSA